MTIVTATPNSKFECRICNAKYQNAVSLGGHVSKSHPGSSSNYSRKVSIREKRFEDRNCLKKAKAWITENLKLDPRQYRALATEVKKMLMAGTDPSKSSVA